MDRETINTSKDSGDPSKSKKTPLSAAETVALESKNSVAILRDWEDKMDAIGLSDDLENIMDALDAPTRARISPETLDKYNSKKALRLSKP